MMFGLDDVIGIPSDTLDESWVGNSCHPARPGGIKGSGGKEASEAIFLMENETFRGDGRDRNSSNSVGRNFPYSEPLSARACPRNEGDAAADDPLEDV